MANVLFTFQLSYLLLYLQQLQQAVEKRNEIIAKLSSNLQEALASRDQVQLEAQSLAGQIQALQKQLQQVSTIHSCSISKTIMYLSLHLHIFCFVFHTDQCRVSANQRFARG